MNAELGRQLVEPHHPELSIRRQCNLLGLPPSTYYHQPAGESPDNLRLLRLMDELHMEFPHYGCRRLAATLSRELAWEVNRKRVRRLMRILGVEALYPKPNLSRPADGHQVHPYLLRNLEIVRPNQVWSTDITYIPMRSGFLYLTAVMDWHSRLVLGWDLSNTMEAGFCRAVLEEALGRATCEIFNSDQGSQYTSAEFQEPLVERGIPISMDGRGRCLDNVFIERLWRSVKYELVYPGDFETGAELYKALEGYFAHYNHRRVHQALNYKTPAEVYADPGGEPTMRPRG